MQLEEDREFLTCPYCGNAHYPDVNTEGVRVLELPSELSCPVCANLPLVHAAAGGERILYCGHCRGMLISMDRFTGIVQDMRSRRQASTEAAHTVNWKDLDRKIKCPKCSQTMDTHPYFGGGNVIIDGCENCSLNWLDYGELDRIVRAPDPQYANREL